MTKRKYTISGGDGGCYGPEFGPVTAEEVCEIMNDDKKFIVLYLEAPIINNKMEINYLVVTPRYEGDTVEKLKSTGCTVGIAIVLPDMLENLFSHGMSDKNTEYWAIGDCTPMA